MSQSTLGADDNLAEDIGNPVFTMSATSNKEEIESTWKSRFDNVGSTNYEPTLYWNELSPTWLQNDTLQSSTRQQEIEVSSTSHRWASPVAWVRPVEQSQVMDTAIIVLDCDGDSENELKSVAVKNGENIVLESKPSQHIYNYLELMYMLCTARIRSRNENVEQRCRKQIILGNIQAVLHFAVVGVSVFDNTVRTKNCFFLFLNGERFYRFVYLALHVINLFTTIYATYLLRRKQNILNMLSAIDIYEKDNHYDIWMPYLALICAAGTVIMAFAYPVFYYGVWDESFVELIQYNSYGLSKDLFLWDWKYMNDTIQNLYEDYTAETTTNIILGIINIMEEFFAFLLIGTIWDLMLLVITAFYLWRQEFITNDVNNVIENVKKPNSEEQVRLQARREEVWKKLRVFGPVEKSINNVFCPLLPSFHIRNVLMYAFFMCACIIPEEDTSGIEYIFHIYNLVKAEITYIIASKIAQQNETIRRMLRNWGMYTGKITVDQQEYDLQAILDELDREPVVFGRGVFAMDERFHFGMLGLVCSLFVSLANGIGSVNSGG